MNAYETTATVNEQGQLHLAGLPFDPGTEVEVIVKPTQVAPDAMAEAAKLEEARARMRDLFARLRGRNTEPIGPLRREELYDRKVLR